jgi:hypothetical protein
MTLQFEQPDSLLQSHLDGSLNLDKSVVIGISPNLCAKPSSGSTEEFSIMSTVLIAKTGTPFRQIRLSAFAYLMGTPFSFTDIF